MNILFISALLPYPLYSGGQIRAYNLLRELSRKHQITLAAFTRTDEELRYIADLSFCKKVITVHRGHAFVPKYVLGSVLHKRSLLTESYAIEEMRQRLDDELKNDSYDVVHIEPWYAWTDFQVWSLPVVAVEHNIEYQVYERYVSRFGVPLARPLLRFDTGKLRTEEEHAWKQARSVVVVSDEDKYVVRQRVSEKKVHAVPNGVSLEEYRLRKPLQYDSELDFLFVGNFRWMQNRDAAVHLLTDIWPEIVSVFPRVRLRLVGKGATAQFRVEIESRGGELLEDIEDIKSEYQQAHLLLAPIRIGGGTSYKILEAMAVGLPVVTTALGAEGMLVEDEKHLLIAETADAYVKAVKKIVNDSLFRERLIRNARGLIEKQYDWKHIATALETVWKRAYEETS